MSATLSYPQITGSRDTEKEEKINKLIEDDIIKIIELDTPDEYGRITDEALLSGKMEWYVDGIIDNGFRKKIKWDE